MVLSSEVWCKNSHCAKFEIFHALLVVMNDYWSKSAAEQLFSMFRSQILIKESIKEFYLGDWSPCACWWRPCVGACCECILCLCLVTAPECAWYQPAGHVMYLTQNRTPLMFQRMEPPPEGGGSEGQAGQGLNGLPNTQPDNLNNMWVVELRWQQTIKFSFCTTDLWTVCGGQTSWGWNVWEPVVGNGQSPRNVPEDGQLEPRQTLHRWSPWQLSQPTGRNMHPCTAMLPPPTAITLSVRRRWVSIFQHLCCRSQDKADNNIYRY